MNNVGTGYIQKQQLQSNKGYIVFSNGLCLQWGKTNETGIKTFSLPFTTAFSIVSGNDYSFSGYDRKLQDLTNTNFYALIKNNTEILYWIAIGIV